MFFPRFQRKIFAVCSFKRFDLFVQHGSGSCKILKKFCWFQKFNHFFLKYQYYDWNILRTLTSHCVYLFTKTTTTTTIKTNETWMGPSHYCNPPCIDSFLHSDLNQWRRHDNYDRKNQQMHLKACTYIFATNLHITGQVCVCHSGSACTVAHVRIHVITHQHIDVLSFNFCSKFT